MSSPSRPAKAGRIRRSIGSNIPSPPVSYSSHARHAYAFDRQQIVVAGNPVTAGLIVSTLRRDGHCVREDREALSSAGEWLEGCQLLITTFSHGGAEGLAWADELRKRMPMLPVLIVPDVIEAGLVANARLPKGFALLRTPVQADDLRAAVRGLLPALSSGTVLARRVSPAATLTRAPATPDESEGCTDG